MLKNTQAAALIRLRPQCAWSAAVDDAHDEMLIAGGSRLSVAAIKRHCELRGLSRFKLPNIIVAQHEALPTVANGKVSKAAATACIVAAMAAGTTYRTAAHSSRL